MGNLSSTNNFVINEDGSITRAEGLGHQNNRTPDFIPVSLSKFKGGFGKKVGYWLLFFLIFAIHGCVVGFAYSASEYDRWADDKYEEYQETKTAFDNKDMSNDNYASYCRNENYRHTPEIIYHYFQHYIEMRNIGITVSSIALVLAVLLDIFAVPRLSRRYPNKKRILKKVDYVQANLRFNYGYPYIMTNNHFGVLNTHKKKVIIKPEYDYIYWVISQNVLCAVVNDKQTFYDINGKELSNVPSSYYTQQSNS